MFRQWQKGLTTVEFAVVAAVLFLMIFAVIEIARAFFVYSMLDEVARRGSRLAAVCPVNDPAIPQLAVFNASGDGSESPLVKGLTPGNVVIDYLAADATIVADPGDSGFAQIRYVRARVVGFQHSVFLPFLEGLSNFQMPNFESILPRESLGVPREGTVAPC